jgi:hypothetical protein
MVFDLAKSNNMVLIIFKFKKIIAGYDRSSPKIQENLCFL